ncbi:MAG: cardiolipin synthase [Bacteroidales bacterium]|nr:cardiolipin synthase [Bacteroidales bacterium]
MSLLAVILVALHVFIGIAAVVWILLGDCDSGWKVAWTVLFFVIPEITIIVYILLGLRYRKGRMFKRLHGPVQERFEKELELDFSVLEPDFSTVADEYKPLAKLFCTCSNTNIVTSGNNLEIITSGERKRELLLEDLRNAKKYIHIEYFRFGADKTGLEVREILEQKAAEGVEVRVLFPNISNRWQKWSFFQHMIDRGVEVNKFTNFKLNWRVFIMRINCQDHRKIVVVDGKVAYTGGMNLNDNYFYRWRDTHLRIEGPSVNILEAAFIDNLLTSQGTLTHRLPYYFTTHFEPSPAPFEGKSLQVVTDAAEYPFTSAQLGYEWVLANAKHYVYLQTPYFLPPEPILDALKNAALRGVDVRIMLPEKVDTPLMGLGNQSYYEECAAAGIKIYIRGGNFIHSKTMVADDYISVVGASNLDTRSFQLNSEVNTFIYDREAAVCCREIFLRDSNSTLLDVDEWKAARSFWNRLGAALMRVLSFNL